MREPVASTGALRAIGAAGCGRWCAIARASARAGALAAACLASASVLLPALHGCTGAIGPAPTAQASADAARPTTLGVLLQPLSDGSPAPAAGPIVGQVRASLPASGTIPMDLTILGARAGRIDVLVEVSRDQRATFRPASVDVDLAWDGEGAVGGRVSFAAGAPATLAWQALRDVGFRSGDGIVLQFTVTQGAVVGPPAQFLVPHLDNLRAAARQVDRYVINYGDWGASGAGGATTTNRALVQRAQLVIAAPDQGGMTPADVAAIGLGVDPVDPSDDVIVLCYLSAGEDLRTAPLTMDQVRGDPLFRGDGTGPRVDPRGAGADGASLDGIDPLGLPSPGGTGFASYYLDDNSVHAGASGASGARAGDGLPDRNAIYGALFVNAGDPSWFDVVDTMTIDSRDRLPGLRELLTPSYGRGFNCDGVFLDTVDTTAPNSFTTSASANPTKFEWTAPGFSAFVRRIHAAYPDKLIAQNRGLFFFDPRHPHYAWNPRGALDFVLFESYRLNPSASEPLNPAFYADNRYNIAPKLMAEANRPDGFRVLSLGYAAGPPGPISPDTLLGRSTAGYDSLLEDIHVTQDLAGFRHYLAEPSLSVVNGFVAAHATLDDSAPPLWTSTFNDHSALPAVAPTPRVGIQRAVAAPGGGITVSWDVALDKNRVQYRLYAQAEPFDFVADPTLSRATRFALTPTVPAAYVRGVGSGQFPYEATLGGLPRGVTQYLLIRAVDESAARNEDQNSVFLTVSPD